MPVTVSSTPAAAAAATPSPPRISTAAAAPTLGPTGSWPRVTTAISTAIASKNEAWTPTACSSSQLRRICAKTATQHEARPARLPPCRLRSTASPRQSSRPLRSASVPQPGAERARSPRRDQRQPPRQAERSDQGERRQRGQDRLDREDRELGGDQRRHLRADRGDERRSAAMRAATPSWPFTRLPRTCMLEARYSTRRATVPPAAPIDRCQASLRESSATIWPQRGGGEQRQRRRWTAQSANSWRRPASTNASTPAASSESGDHDQDAVAASELARALKRAGDLRRARRGNGGVLPSTRSHDSGRPVAVAISLLLPASLRRRSEHRLLGKAVFSARSCCLAPSAFAVHIRRGGINMATGTVKWFNDDKGFGFITPDEGDKDLFVHHTAISGEGFKSLTEGAKVSYETESGPQGSERGTGHDALAFADRTEAPGPATAGPSRSRSITPLCQRHGARARTSHRQVRVDVVVAHERGHRSGRRSTRSS